MNDQQIEQEIQAKGLSAPRVTKEHVDALMSRVVYTFDVRPNGSTTTFAHAFLDGSFYLASGRSACVSVANFNAELGMKMATAQAQAAARDKLWELEGYALKKQLDAQTCEQATDGGPNPHYNPDAEAAEKALAIVRAFVEKHRVNCPETIHQTDRVIENAYSLIEDLCDVAGYYQYPEEA